MSRLFEADDIGAATVWAEARGEPFEGQVAVAEVILRRAATGYQSDGTVEGACLKFAQFSCWWWKQPPGQLLAIARIDTASTAFRSAREAWQTARAGSSVVPDALLYANLDVLPAPPAWATPDKFVAKIGHHSFYKR